MDFIKTNSICQIFEKEETMMKKLKVILIGAGGRGRRYTNVMKELPEQFELVGIAEPVENLREGVRQLHGVDPKDCYESWEEILDRPKFADVAVIATMDQMHYAPAMKAIELGYDLLLEKPVAPTPEECTAIWRQAEKYGTKIMVCHVLRYTPFFMRLKEIIQEGTLGDIITMEHIEAVGNIHQTTSFVRGRWGNEGRSTPMLLQKCCHDLDILQWLLEKECTKIQSFGSLVHFRSENAPEGAPERCMDGCPHADTCYYHAYPIYVEKRYKIGSPRQATMMLNPTKEDILHTMATTQVGKCVYKCDNDVVDHQIVNMEFEGGVTVSMTMSAFTEGGRKTHIMGTKGELWAEMSNKETPFIFYDFATREKRALSADIAIAGDSITTGHGGGDAGIVDALYRYVTGELTAEEVSEIGISCKNHMLAFAAEESRHNDTVVSVPKYAAKYFE